MRTNDLGEILRKRQIEIDLKNQLQIWNRQTWRLLAQCWWYNFVQKMGLRLRESSAFRSTWLLQGTCTCYLASGSWDFQSLSSLRTSVTGDAAKQTQIMSWWLAIASRGLILLLQGCWTAKKSMHKGSISVFLGSNGDTRCSSFRCLDVMVNHSAPDVKSARLWKVESTLAVIQLDRGQG